MSRKSLNLNDIQLIESIQTQLKEQIIKFQNNNIFVRLSTRSP